MQGALWGADADQSDRHAERLSWPYCRHASWD